MKKACLFLLLLAIILPWPASAEAAKIRFRFDAWDGPRINVYVSRPVGLAPDRPVVFVMHGTNRNADEYRDQWHALALEHQFLLVVPEFNRRNFPGAGGYNLGRQQDESGQPLPKSQWSYAAIEPLFDDVVERFGMTATRYALYGHSAGAQFVHRFIYFTSQARVSQIVSANAGWYMMPDFNKAYPYGLGDSMVTLEMLQAALRLPVTILLGEEDTDPEHPNLRTTSQAMAQGAYRLQRGQRFFDTARNQAQRLGVPLNWRVVTVPGADHDNRLMAPAAIPYLLGTGDRAASLHPMPASRPLKALRTE